MKKLDIAAMRHPTSSQQELDIMAEPKSYAIVVDMSECEKNVRIAQERFMIMQMEQLRLL